MLGVKDNEEIDSYLYKVCEISSCEEEAVDIYEDDTKTINICDEHDKILNANKWTLW
jgi:transcription elongation factor